MGIDNIQGQGMATSEKAGPADCVLACCWPISSRLYLPWCLTGGWENDSRFEQALCVEPFGDGVAGSTSASGQHC